MNNGDLFKEHQCEECGQLTMTRHWQPVNFCANCGVAVGSTETDRTDHLSMGVALSSDERDQLLDKEEISLTRALTDDLQLTINLMYAPP